MMRSSVVPSLQRCVYVCVGVAYMYVLIAYITHNRAARAQRVVSLSVGWWRRRQPLPAAAAAPLHKGTECVYATPCPQLQQ
jgi:hypothetical protein